MTAGWGSEATSVTGASAQVLCSELSTVISGEECADVDDLGSAAAAAATDRYVHPMKRSEVQALVQQEVTARVSQLEAQLAGNQEELLA